MYTRIQWSRDLLIKIGNGNHSSYVTEWVAAWTLLETSPPPHIPAMYNLLNTRHTMPGSTNYNSAGVQNFLTYSEGLQANVNALNDGFYPLLLHALQTGAELLLGVGSIPTDQTIQSELDKWCGGCGYAAKLLSLIGQHTNDAFPDRCECSCLQRGM